MTNDSLTVAEFIATHPVAKEIMWARALLVEMGHPQLALNILVEDNISIIAMINNDINSNKTKHIDVRSNLTREQALKLIIKLKHSATKEMTSDILTKALDPKTSTHLRAKLVGMLVLCDSHCISRGVHILNYAVSTALRHKGAKGS